MELGIEPLIKVNEQINGFNVWWGSQRKRSKSSVVSVYFPEKSKKITKETKNKMTELLKEHGLTRNEGLLLT